MTIRVLFAGTPQFAVKQLDALIAATDIQVVAVMSQPDRKAGRGQRLQSSPVAQLAKSAQLPLLQPDSIRGPVLQEIASYDPDIAVVAAYGRIFGKKTLSLPTHGCLNVHASLLPKWRGASPVTHAILSGDRKTGISFMAMNEGLDTGAVYSQFDLNIADDDTTESLTNRLSELAAQHLPDAVRNIVNQRLTAKPQSPLSEVSFAKPLVRSDGLIDWSQSAYDIERRVRAMQPWPKAYFIINECEVKIHSCAVRSGSGKMAPGTVISADHKHGLVVSTGSDEHLQITELQRPSKAKSQATAFGNDSFFANAVGSQLPLTSEVEICA